MLLCGGLVGATVGVWLFSLLRSVGQLDLVISLLYVVLSRLGRRADAVGEHRRNAQSSEKPAGAAQTPGQHNWIHGLPLKMRFKKSRSI